MAPREVPGTRGLAVILSGPSGVGKTTIRRRLVERHGYERSISTTTRPPRAGERDGEDYRFLTRAAFGEALRRGEFLEHSEHFGNLYGTPRAPVERAIAEGRTILLEIDVNGALQVMERLPAARRYAIFLSPPAPAEQERRLRGRGSDSEESVRTRLERADMENARKMRYDAEVRNDDLERAVAEVHQLILRAEARKSDGCGQA